jgi:hypothetical protein
MDMLKLFVKVELLKLAIFIVQIPQRELSTYIANLELHNVLVLVMIRLKLSVHELN